jgi:hypothetical protein
MFSSDKPTTRLRELRGSGYEIAKGQPDIRGWDVRDDHRRKIGKVRDLIFDLRASKVRYMVVDVLDVKDLDLEKRTVLVPIGLAELDQRDDDVILSTITPFQLRALPRYDKATLGAKAERDISMVFGREGVLGNTTAATNTNEDVDDTFYNHDHFNEDNMYRKRRNTDNSLNEEREKRSGSLRRESEMSTPISSADRDDKSHSGQESYRDNETDEEYYRRTGRNRNYE